MTDLDAAHGVLTGAGMGDLLRAGLTGTPDADLPGFTWTLDAVHHRPGAECSAGYEVTYATPAGDVTEYLVATTADVATPVTLRHDGVTLHLWRHPADPRLPALASVCDAATVGGWLAGTPGSGRPAFGGSAQVRPAPGGSFARLEVLTYRPLRRAVVRATLGEQVAYVKAIRPDKGPDLMARHRIMDAAELGPRVLAMPLAGVVVTAASAGVPLAEVLAGGVEGVGVPRPDAVADLLDRLPATVVELPERPSWTARADFHGASAAAVLPGEAAEIAAMVAEIEDLVARTPVGPVVPTHGDLHEANLFVAGGEPVGLIDVDSLGPGRREDDLACIVGHLAVLPDLSPGHYGHLAPVVRAWAEAFEEVVDAAAFRVRVAGVILSLVAGGTPEHALARLDLARAWLWRARHALGTPVE